MAYMIHHPYDPYYQGVTAVDEKGKAISTLFVSGLPDDIKAREIHNLFRRRPGFDYCQLKYTGRGNQVVAFATFFDHQSALTALHSLNGVKFDPQTGSTLHIELARSNSRRKRKSDSGPYVVIDNRRKDVSSSEASSSNDDDNDSDEDPGATDTNSTVHGESANGASEIAGDPNHSPATLKENSGVVAEGGGNPCSTLFLANMGPNCTEAELKEALSCFPGFNLIKMRVRGGMPVAFADFKEIEQANNAMESLQGTMLPSSDRGGLHIEYARSKMRKR